LIHQISWHGQSWYLPLKGFMMFYGYPMVSPIFQTQPTSSHHGDPFVEWQSSQQ
jgi:hypothetical protein